MSLKESVWERPGGDERGGSRREERRGERREGRRVVEGRGDGIWGRKGEDDGQ